jgi:hypothetical protein
LTDVAERIARRRLERKRKNADLVSRAVWPSRATGSTDTVTVPLVILSVASAIAIVIVGVMFWWGAREDGRDQKRREARGRLPPR